MWDWYQQQRVSWYEWMLDYYNRWLEGEGRIISSKISLGNGIHRKSRRHLFSWLDISCVLSWKKAFPYISLQPKLHRDRGHDGAVEIVRNKDTASRIGQPVASPGY